MPYVGNRPLPGLQPVNNGLGNATPRVREYAVASNTDIGEGNLLVKAATGVTLAAMIIPDGGFVVGVAAQNYTSDTNGIIKVYDDPNQEFACLSDATMTTTVLIEMVGQFTNMVTGTNVMNTTLGQGNTQIDMSAVSSTRSTTLSLQVVGYQNSVGDTAGTTQAGNYAQVVVKIPNATHMWTSQSTTFAT